MSPLTAVAPHVRGQARWVVEAQEANALATTTVRPTGLQARVARATHAVLDIGFGAKALILQLK